MGRSDWADLSDLVRAAIQEHTGEVTGSALAPAGEHSDITATLHTDTGPVFIKGIRTEPAVPDVWSLRREARISPYVRYAPRLLWTVEAGGWLVLGFEHVDGRHADFCPGSPDLKLTAGVVADLQTADCPDVVKLDIARRWVDHVDDVTPFAGDALVHADINPSNLLITSDDRVYVVDWGFASRGAAWVELAILVQWLIGAGHSPRQAEEWVGQFPSWRGADPGVVDVFAAANADRWRGLTAVDPPAWAVRLADLTRQWATYRQGRSS